MLIIMFWLRTSRMELYVTESTLPFVSIPLRPELRNISARISAFKYKSSEWVFEREKPEEDWTEGSSEVAKSTFP
jgi:hypothetical protein